MKIIRLCGSPPEPPSNEEEKRQRALVEIEREMIALRKRFERGEVDGPAYREQLRIVEKSLQALLRRGR